MTLAKPFIKWVGGKSQLLDEIKENEYNLNIPRYVDTFEEEEPVDLQEVKKMLAQDDEDIKKLEAEIAEQLKILGV